MSSRDSWRCIDSNNHHMAAMECVDEVSMKGKARWESRDPRQEFMKPDGQRAGCNGGREKLTESPNNCQSALRNDSYVEDNVHPQVPLVLKVKPTGKNRCGPPSLTPTGDPSTVAGVAAPVMVKVSFSRQASTGINNRVARPRLQPLPAEEGKLLAHEHIVMVEELHDCAHTKGRKVMSVTQAAGGLPSEGSIRSDGALSPTSRRGSCPWDLAVSHNQHSSPPSSPPGCAQGRGKRPLSSPREKKGTSKCGGCHGCGQGSRKRRQRVGEDEGVLHRCARLACQNRVGKYLQLALEIEEDPELIQAGSGILGLTPKQLRVEVNPGDAAPSSPSELSPLDPPYGHDVHAVAHPEGPSLWPRDPRLRAHAGSDEQRGHAADEVHGADEAMGMLSGSGDWHGTCAWPSERCLPADNEVPAEDDPVGTDVCKSDVAPKVRRSQRIRRLW